MINLFEVYLINLFNDTITMNTETPNIISQTQSDFEEDQVAEHHERDSKNNNKKDSEEDKEGIEEEVVNPVGCSDNNSVFVRSHYRRRTSISKTANKKQKMVPITKWFKVEHDQAQTVQNRRNDEIQIREDRKIAKSMHIEMLRDLCRNIN